MQTFKAHKSFVPASLRSVVILPNTDYKVVNSKAATGGIIIKVVDKNKNQKIHIKPSEISKYGIIQTKLTYTQVVKVLSNIKFLQSCIDFNWGWEVTEISGFGYCEGCDETILTKGFLINTTFKRPDINTGKIGIGRGRRMWIEETATKDSLIMTAWVCVDLIIKHEAMEAFTVYGAKILDPHKKIKHLAYPHKIKMK